jgi:hypothetical protein
MQFAFSAAALIRPPSWNPWFPPPAPSFRSGYGAASALWYAFLAAMIFVVFLPGYWTSSHSAQHLIVAGFYATG